MEFSLHGHFVCVWFFSVWSLAAGCDLWQKQATFDHVVSYASIYHLEKDEQCHLGQLYLPRAVPLPTKKGKLRLESDCDTGVWCCLCWKEPPAGFQSAPNMSCTLLVVGCTAYFHVAAYVINGTLITHKSHNNMYPCQLTGGWFRACWIHALIIKSMPRKPWVHPGSVGIQLVRKLKIGGRAFLGWNHGPVTWPWWDVWWVKMSCSFSRRLNQPPENWEWSILLCLDA